MRRFSDIEKGFIMELCKKAKPQECYIPANLLYGTFHGEEVAFDATNREFIFYRPKGEINNEKLLSIEGKIIEATLLLDYLEKEGLIFYIKDSNGGLKHFGVPDNSNLIDLKTKEAKSKRVPEGIEEPLMKSMNYRVIAGQTLRDFVDNGFKTVEDLQLEQARIQSEKAVESLEQARIQSEKAIASLNEAKKNTRWSIAAVATAVIAMIVAVLFQIFYTQSVRVEEVKTPVIQEIKEEILPKHEIEKKVLPTVQQEKQNNTILTSGNKTKRIN